MRRPLLVSLLALIVLVHTGCASIVSTSTRRVKLTSYPSGATVQVFDKEGISVFKGTTPTSVVLETGAGYFSPQRYRAHFTMPGRDQVVMPISSKLNGWYIGNLLFGGLIGFLIVDPLTGAMYRLGPTFLNAEFGPRITPVRGTYWPY